MRTTITLAPDVAAAVARRQADRALAIEHGLVMASTDTDVARFKALRWENPLA